MQVIVSELTKCERMLEVTIAADRVDGAYERAMGRAAKRLALPGFRRGKVPLVMAKKYISVENLGGDVVEDVVPQAYSEALRQNDLQPISQPRWELVQRERGKDLIFKVSFEVKPQLDVVDYKGVELKNEREEITDEHVEKAIDEIRGSRSQLVDVAEDRALQEDDLALVDYSSTLDGEVVEGGAASNYLLEVRRDHFIPGFVDNLIGVKPGEEKEFDITFPEDYPNEALAGKLVHFHFKLDKIKTRELPEANDEFAKSVSPFETLDELRKELRERLEGNVERKVREQVAIKIIDRLMPQVGNDVVPKSLHSYRTKVEYNRRMQQLEQSGLTLERFLADRNIDQQQWVMELSVMGMLESRVEILLESIAKLEGLHPTDDEVEELLQVEAANRGVTVPQLRASIEKDGSQDLIRYALLRAKVMDFLFDSAKVEFVPPGTPIEEPPAAEESAAQESAAQEKKAKAKGKAKKAATEEEAAPEAEEAEVKPKAKKAREPKEPKVEESATGEGEAKPKAKRAPKKADAE